MPSDFKVRPMTVSDLDAVVRLHIQGFQKFFLTVLGPRFLRLLYEEILKRPDHVAVLATDESGDPAGFVVGVCDQRRFYGDMARRRWFAFALASFSAAIRHPTIIPRLARAFTYPQAAQAAPTKALLMSICVRPDISGKGVGRLVLAGFLDEMKKRGVPAVSLATDRDANDRVNLFYRQAGFRLTRAYSTAEGRWMNEYSMEWRA